jgi:hypothetical protein
MYQIEIALSMGSLFSKPEELETIKNFLQTLPDSSDVSIELEDGSILFMTSGMINSTAFVVKKVNS